MSNTLVTSKAIAREALPVLEANKVMAGLVHTDYKNDFKEKYNIVTVTKPAQFTAVEFDGDLTGEYQDVTQGSVDISLGYIASVDMKITSEQMTMEIAQFTEEITVPALEAITQQIDANILSLYKDIPYFYGTAGTTPDELKDISQARKILQGNKAQLSNRSLVIDEEAEADLGILDAFINQNYVGTTAGLTEAALGRKLGFNVFMDQNVPTHTAGLYSALADVTITTGAAAATSIVLTSTAGASTATLLEGDLFTLDGGQYVVTADTAAASSGVVTVAIYPALAKAYGDMTAVTVAFADVSAKAHTANMAFQKNAFAFVNRPLMPASGQDSYTTNIKGINIRVTMGYDFDTKSNIVSYDCLYGVKTLYPELAAQLLG